MSEKEAKTGESNEALALFFGKIVEAGGDVTSAILHLIGNGIQAIGVAAASVDPLQFAFIVGMFLFTVNYLDQTEPYKTIIATARLHNLIAGLRAPGQGVKALSELKIAADCCIQSYSFIGKPVPSQLYTIRDTADTEFSIFQAVDNFIPGAGAVENFVTGLFNGFGVKTSAQLVSDSAIELRAACKKATGVDCANINNAPDAQTAITTFLAQTSIQPGTYWLIVGQTPAGNWIVANLSTTKFTDPFLSQQLAVLTNGYQVQVTK